MSNYNNRMNALELWNHVESVLILFIHESAGALDQHVALIYK